MTSAREPLKYVIGAILQCTAVDALVQIWNGAMQWCNWCNWDRPAWDNDDKNDDDDDDDKNDDNEDDDDDEWPITFIFQCL